MKLVSLRMLGLIAVLFCAAVVGFGQSADRSAALQLFNAGDYARAVDVLKKVVKANDKDGEAWYMLGGSYLKLEKYKDSIKALKRAVQAAPNNDVYQALLAYTYVTIGDHAATTAANAALAINPNNPEAHYVLGVVAYRTEAYKSAYDRAKRVIQIKPDFAAGHRLKAQSLIASYMALDGKLLPPAVRADLLPEAVADLDKFLTLTKNGEQRKEVEDEVSTLRLVAEYYSKPENRVVRDSSVTEPPDPNKIPLKIVSKSPAGYTDRVRTRNVQGTIILLVSFDAIGKIGAILVTKSLDPDLDRNAIAAARRIKFIPEQRNGVPVTVFKRLEYSFAIY